ncbi:MAG: hypothetical protein VYC34_07475 [Planctomycetota bacterium]|nr:hypothetical protein [Planctomycetota bacterium]
MSSTSKRFGAASPTRFVSAALCAAATLLCGNASAQQSDSSTKGAGGSTLIDRSLRTEEINLLSLTGDSIVYEDELGRRRQATLAGFVALTSPRADDGAAAGDARGRSRTGRGAPPPPGYIELTDGQRFPGMPGATAGDEEVVVWSHPLFGEVRFALENVLSVVMNKAVLDEAQRDRQFQFSGGADDELLLINGDSVRGFLVSLGDPIEIEVDGEIVTIPPELVAAARLANPPTGGLQGLVVWLEDGSVAVVTSLDASERRGLSLRLPQGSPVETDLHELRAVAFDAGRLRPLASLEMIGERAIERRVLLHPARPLTDASKAAPPMLNAPDIEFPGPLAAKWRLPGGARRFGAVAEMPMDALPWGDCEIVVLVDGEERLRERLGAGAVQLELSVPLEGMTADAQELEIRVEPGEYGPVNDRVILRRPILLIEKKTN